MLLLLCVRFDLIFLDANKDGYYSYYTTIMEGHLLLPGGLLLVDNALMKVCCTAVLLYCVLLCCLDFVQSLFLCHGFGCMLATHASRSFAHTPAWRSRQLQLSSCMCRDTEQINLILYAGPHELSIAKNFLTATSCGDCLLWLAVARFYRGFISLLLHACFYRLMFTAFPGCVLSLLCP